MKRNNKEIKEQKKKFSSTYFMILVIILLLLLLSAIVGICILVTKNNNKLSEAAKKKNEVTEMLNDNYVFWNLFCGEKYLNDSTVVFNNITYNEVNNEKFDTIDKLKNYMEETYPDNQLIEINKKINSRYIQFENKLYVVKNSNPHDYEFSKNIEIIKEEKRIVVKYELITMDIPIRNGKYQIQYSPFECDFSKEQ